MLNTTDKIIRHKTGLLNLAEELGNVSKACQVMGMSRDMFYLYTFLISASVTAWAIFSEKVDRMTLIGMALIVGAGIFIALRSASMDAGDQPDAEKSST